MAHPESSANNDAFPIALARRLTRNYGPLRALDTIDLTVRSGDFLTIFGPNGAGKTTLLKILATIMRPSSGTLSLFGLDPAREPDAVKRRIGLIGHAGYLYGGLGARDNLIFFARLYDLPSAADRADAALEQVGLADRARDAVRTYSRGMQQRLAIARALIHDPALLLLDEPFTGLDQHASVSLRKMLRGLHGAARTLVMVTHHLDEGLDVSTRVAIMSYGRIAHEESTANLTRSSLGGPS
jgi:heme exporter protein A